MMFRHSVFHNVGPRPVVTATTIRRSSLLLSQSSSLSSSSRGFMTTAIGFASNNGIIKNNNSVRSQCNNNFPSYSASHCPQICSEHWCGLRLAASTATTTNNKTNTTEPDFKALLAGEVQKFLRRERFATDVVDPRGSYATPAPPQDVTQEILDEAYWYAWLPHEERKKSPKYDSSNIDETAKSKINEKIANDIIQYYDDQNTEPNFDLQHVGISWRHGHDGMQVHYKLFLMEQFVRDNKAALLKLLKSNPTTFLTIATKRFNKVMLPSGDLYNFYVDRSVVVMSDSLYGYTKGRFVCSLPAKPIHFTAHLEANSTTGSPTHSKVTIIGGWSGAGKTCVATLPSNTKIPICIVVGANVDLFQDKKYEALFPKNMTPFDRDVAASLLLVQGIVKALKPGCGDSIQGNSKFTTLEKKKKFNDSGVEEEVDVEVPALAAGFFDNSVEDLLRCGVNAQLGGSYEVRIVLDEVGLYSEFLRATCKIWNQLRQFLAKVWKVEPNHLSLYVVGSGTESAAVSSQGTYSSDYAVFVCSAPNLFSTILRSLADNSPADKTRIICKEFYEFLFSSSSSSSSSSQTHDARTFLQLVEDNARCAALAMRKITYLVEQQHASTALFISHLSAWSADISGEFIKLNGLSLADHPYQEIGNALRIVMSRRQSLLEDEHENFLVRYGILVQTRNELNQASVPAHVPPYRIQQAFVIMFLLHYKLDFSGHYIGVNDSFEHLVALHHALCLVLQLGTASVQTTTPLSQQLFDGVALKEGAPVETVVLRRKLSDGDEDKAAAIDSIVFSKRKTQLRDKFGAISEEWKKIVAKKKGAIVIVNGGKASFADVIVLTHKKLFLTQCKYYEPGTSLSDEKQDEEFVKMVSSSNNVFTRELLRECCIDDTAGERIEDVEVVASIFRLFDKKAPSQVPPALVAKSQYKPWKIDSTPLNFVEKFNVSQRVIPVFSPANASKDNTDSQLYPLLIAPLDYDHLAEAVKEVVVFSKTRDAIEPRH